VGVSVILATEGQKGVKKAIEEKPDLILMDIMMLRMNGREATRMIRSIPETQDIPVLAARLLLKHSDRKSCLEAGCTDYIQCKPRLLRRAQSRWGFQRGETAALPFGRKRGFKPRVRYNLIVKPFSFVAPQEKIQALIPGSSPNIQ